MSAGNEHYELRSYGRRRGRKPSDRQQRLLTELLPRVALELATPLPPPCGEGSGVGVAGGGTSATSNAPSGRLPAGESEGADFGGGTSATSNAPSGRLPAGESEGANKKYLEIGFGGGEHLLWQARHNPQVAVLGCEPFEDGVIKVLSAIDDEKLANIRLHMGDARDVLRALPEASIDRAFILFPDPWPKRKHRKRRLVNDATLDLLARCMKPGAELRIGTDIGDYARTMLEAFTHEPRFAWLAESPVDWRIRPPDWPQTRYEAKAAREGRTRYYFRFLRT